MATIEIDLAATQLPIDQQSSGTCQIETPNKIANRVATIEIDLAATRLPIDQQSNGNNLAEIDQHHFANSFFRSHNHLVNDRGSISLRDNLVTDRDIISF